jgi:hypothetical protein
MSESAAYAKKRGEELHPEFTIKDFVRCLEHPSILTFGDKDGDGLDDLEDEINPHIMAMSLLHDSRKRGVYTKSIRASVARERKHKPVDTKSIRASVARERKHPKSSPQAGKRTSVRLPAKPKIPGVESNGDVQMDSITINTRSRKTVV